MDIPMTAQTVTITGHDGDEIEAYFAWPTSPGPHPGVVVIHHMPGYDRSTKEIVRTFAFGGYAALCPNLHHRFGAWGGVIAGTAGEVARELAAEVNRGVEGFVLQFSDFGTPETIEHFMTKVVPLVESGTA